MKVKREAHARVISATKRAGQMGTGKSVGDELGAGSEYSESDDGSSGDEDQDGSSDDDGNSSDDSDSGAEPAKAKPPASKRRRITSSTQGGGGGGRRGQQQRPDFVLGNDAGDDGRVPVPGSGPSGRYKESGGFYISHVPTGDSTAERFMAVGSGDQLRDAVLDLTAEDAEGAARQRSATWHWDAKSKKYVKLQKGEVMKAGRRVKERGGGKVGKKDEKTGVLYQKWARRTKLSVGGGKVTQRTEQMAAAMEGRFDRGGRGWSNPMKPGADRDGGDGDEERRGKKGGKELLELQEEREMNCVMKMKCARVGRWRKGRRSTCRNAGVKVEVVVVAGEAAVVVAAVEVVVGVVVAVDLVAAKEEAVAVVVVALVEVLAAVDLEVAAVVAEEKVALKEVAVEAVAVAVAVEAVVAVAVVAVALVVRVTVVAVEVHLKRACRVKRVLE